jgi:hypothetical protein|nr:VCBS repeat-containing protein [Deltaproteobacteria bacterium]
MPPPALRFRRLCLAALVSYAWGCGTEQLVDPPRDASTPDASTRDVPALDAPTPDRPALDVPALDVPAPDRPADVPAPDRPADVPAPDRPDAARDGGPPVDAGMVTGRLAFDAPEEWTRLGTSYAVAADLTGDGLREAVLLDTFNPVGSVRVTFAVARPGVDFVPAGSFTVTGYSASLDYADFDGDRRVDVLVRVQSASTPNSYIARGRGDGTFAPVEALTFNARLPADLDRDGRSDLIDASLRSPVVHLRTAAGGFTRVPTTITLGDAPTVVGDFDGDGAPDLANGTVVYRGLGGGRFAAGLPATCAGCAQPSRMLVARLDGDARDDLVIADNAQVTVLLGQPSGALSRAAAYAVPRPVQLAAGDLDGDRHTDLVVIGQPLATTSDDLLQLLYGDGTGSFPDRRDYENTRPNSRLPVITDADGDGRNDVVLDGRFVAHNRGGRRLRAPELSAFAPESVSRNQQIAALDGPGPLSLVVARAGTALDRWPFQADRRLGARSSCAGPGMTVYRGVADITGDGRPDVFSSAAGVLSVWPGTGGCAFGVERRSNVTMYSRVFVRVDGDALPDLVFSTAGGLGVALATAPGAFGPTVTSAFRGDVSYLAAGDWNRDGAVDALVVDNEAHAMTVFNGDAGRRLTAGQVFPGASTDELWYPKAGDVDGDGDLDVVITNSRASQLELLRNNGAGVFAREALGPIDPVVELTLADLDNDGRLEVLAADNQLATSIYRVDARGATRLLRLQIPRGAFPYDVDGDGDLDLVYVNAYGGSAVVAVTNNRFVD